MKQYFIFKSWRYQLKKLVKVLLHVASLVDEPKIVENTILNFLRKLQGSHGLIYHVELLLEIRIFFTDVGHQSSHVTENEGSYDGTKNDHERGEQSLWKSNGGTFVTYNQEDHVMENDSILVPNGQSEEIGLVKVEVFCGNPIWILLN